MRSGVALNIVQYGAVGWVWDRLVERLRDDLCGQTLVTPCPIQDADRYVFLCAEYALQMAPDRMAKATVIVNHFEPYGGAFRSLPEQAPMLKSAGHVVCMNVATAKLLRENGILAHVIGYGVDLDTFKPTPAIRQESEFVLAVSGRVYPDGRKGEGLLPLIAAELQKATPGRFAFRFTGAGWGRTIAQVRMTGCKADEWQGDYPTYPSFYAQADALLVTALNEGGPYAPLEALACGLPVVSTPVGWMPELEEEARAIGSVRLAKPDPVELSKAILAMSQRTPAKEMARASIAHRTWPRYVREWAKVLKMDVRQKGDSK